MTALYRKYRSAVLGDLIGQDHIVRTLSSELRLGQLAHAYLFAGTRGTGKTSTARILARAVNCLDPQDGEPCNRCAACTEILDGSAVDVLEIDAASNRGIDEMRDLRERVRSCRRGCGSRSTSSTRPTCSPPRPGTPSSRPSRSRPAHVLFVLCTTEPHKVPETVRSRVQRFDFHRVSGQRIDTHLRTIAAAEGVVVEPSALRLIAVAAQGSVRDALSLLDQCIATGERPLTLETCRVALGLADPGVVSALLRALAEGDAAAALRGAAAAFDTGADPRQLLRECSRLARAAELFAVGLNDAAGLDADEEELCRSLAARRPDGFWLRVLEVAGATELELRQPVDARLQVEACLLRLCRDRGVADADLIGRLEFEDRRAGAEAERGRGRNRNGAGAAGSTPPCGGRRPGDSTSPALRLPPKARCRLRVHPTTAPAPHRSLPRQRPRRWGRGPRRLWAELRSRPHRVPPRSPSRSPRRRLGNGLGRRSSRP